MLPAARLFHGWFIVAATFGVLFFAYGLQFSYGVFVGGMTGELGWSRAQTALPYAIYVFAYSALSAVTGQATDRFGPRRVVSLGAVLLALGWGTSALVHEPWQLGLTLGVVAALGMSVAWVPCNATVTRWFTRRRGTAVAIASTGASLGNFLVPPLAAWLVTVFGWRLTLGCLALVSALAMLLAARYLIRDPETLGLWPDGDAEAPSAASLSGGKTVSELLWTGPFLLIIAIYFMTWLVVFVPFLHIAAFAGDLGIPAVAAASVLSVIGIGGMAGRLSCGVVADAFGPCPTLIVICSMQAVSFLLFASADTLTALWIAALVFGISYGGGVALLPPLCGNLFGRRHVGSVVGAIFAIAGSPAAVGPYLAGWMYDVSGSYVTAFHLAAVLNVVAVVLTLVLARRLRTTREPPG